MTTAVYAGSFDPVTEGHVHIIEQAARLFDRLIVAVGVNPAKKYTFTVEERLDHLRDVVLRMSITRNRYKAEVVVAEFTNLYLVDFARSQEATHIVRGLRNVADFEFERSMRNINHDLAPEIESVFLMPNREFAEVSSSFVKGLVGPAGWESVVERYVPHTVFEALCEKFPPASGVQRCVA